MSQRQRVQDGIRRSPHSHVEHEGVYQRLLGNDVERANVLVEAALERMRGFLRDLDALGVQLGRAPSIRPPFGGNGSIAGQRQDDSLAQAVHGVCREHAGAASAAGAGALGQRPQLHLAHLPHAMASHALEHGDEVGVPLARQHRPAADVHRRDVDPHHGVVHGRDDLVAVGDADPGVARVGADDGLDLIGDQLARGQRVFHAEMAHGDAVADGSAHVHVPDVEAERLQFVAHNGADPVQVRVPRNLVGVGIDHRDERLLQVVERADHALGHHQRCGREHVRALGDNAAALLADILDAFVHSFYSGMGGVT